MAWRDFLAGLRGHHRGVHGGLAPGHGEDPLARETVTAPPHRIPANRLKVGMIIRIHGKAEVITGLRYVFSPRGAEARISTVSGLVYACEPGQGILVLDN